MKWSETTVCTDDGPMKAVAPTIISASRSTDIPAFYADWFMNRLKAGYAKWVNPFNRRSQYISFEKAKVIVFWTKNPKPLMKHLNTLDKLGIAYYFQFTLNDYEDEMLEPGVPPLQERIEAFRTLSQVIGKERVIWRFDPLIITKQINVNTLLEKIEKVGSQIALYTSKLVFSFADIAKYKKVQNSLKRFGVEYQEFKEAEMLAAAKGIRALCDKWHIAAATCAEQIELFELGIEHNKCVDDKLILKISDYSEEVCRILGFDNPLQGELFNQQPDGSKKLKDVGQRAECGCIFSKDIGQYNTCLHLCAYCYANTSEKTVRRNAELVSSESESIICQ